jgi:voltage-gated potassium channel
MRERFSRRAARAIQRRRVFSYLVFLTGTTGVLCGLLAHLIDRKDFPTFGIGVWWAIVTLGTVGYGDVVPHTAWGRVLGSVTIVFGVTFISFLIAIVTSMLVEANRPDKTEQEQEVQALLHSIDARLRAIETRLPE